MNRLFLGAFLLGVLPLIEPSCILLAAIILVVALFFTISFRKIVAMVAGWVLPIAAASYVMWYRGDSIFALAVNMWQDITTSTYATIAHIPYGAIILAVTALAILGWGFIYLTVKRSEALILVRIRRQLRFFAATSIIALAMLLLPDRSLTTAAIVASPLAILLSFILSATPTNSSTIAYWTLLAITVVHLFVE